MGYLRTDGKYKIYIIKHLYNSKSNFEWDNSGDCRHFIPRTILWDYNKQQLENKIFDKFTACGKCWQKTGVCGSFAKRDAIKILNKIAKWNPQHRFKVCVLYIDQTTEDIIEKKYAQIA